MKTSHLRSYASCSLSGDSDQFGANQSDVQTLIQPSLASRTSHRVMEGYCRLISYWKIRSRLLLSKADIQRGSWKREKRDHGGYSVMAAFEVLS